MGYQTSRAVKNAEKNLESVIEDAEENLEVAKNNLQEFKDKDKRTAEAEAEYEQSVADRAERREQVIERLSAIVATGADSEAVEAARSLLNL